MISKHGHQKVSPITLGVPWCNENDIKRLQFSSWCSPRNHHIITWQYMWITNLGTFHSLMSFGQMAIQPYYGHNCHFGHMTQENYFKCTQDGITYKLPCWKKNKILKKFPLYNSWNPLINFKMIAWWILTWKTLIYFALT